VLDLSRAASWLYTDRLDLAVEHSARATVALFRLARVRLTERTLRAAADRVDPDD